MGLIQVPRGVQTKRGYAPADIARSAAESAAPWFWVGHVLLAHAVRGGALQDRIAGRLAEKSSDQVTTPLGARGLAVETPSGVSPGGMKFGHQDSLNIENELTVWVHLKATQELIDAAWIDIFSKRENSSNDFDSSKQYAIQAAGRTPPVWRGQIIIGDSNNSIESGPIEADKEYLLHLARGVDGELSLWVNGVLDGSRSTTGAIDTGSGPLLVAQGIDSGVAPSLYYGMGIANRALSEDEIAEHNFDPFAPFRRRPLLVPVSSGGGATATSVTEGAQGADAWSALAVAPASLTQAAQAGDTLSAVSVVGASLTEAVAAQDSDAGPAQALGAVTEAATGNDLADAVAQISAAITAGAAAGESWVAEAQAVVDLIESGAAGDTITHGAESAEQAAVSEGSTAGETFAAAVSAVASLTGASTAADALVAALVAMGSITHAASASDTHSAVGQVMAALTEVIDAGALYTASATVAQSIAEAIQAGDTWSAVVPGTDYLVASAITITAALSGRIDLEAALSGSASLDPAVSGSIKIKPD